MKDWGSSCKIKTSSGRQETSLKIKKMKAENQELREQLTEADFKRGLISVSPSFRKDVIAATPDARAPFVASTQSSAVCKPLLNQREASSASSADGASTDRAVPERPLETEPFHRDVHPKDFVPSGSALDGSVPSGSASKTELFHRGVYPKETAKRGPECIPCANDITTLPFPRIPTALKNAVMRCFMPAPFR